jgi:uncharacterized protein
MIALMDLTAVPLRARLQAALRDAMKARDRAATNALRSALAAIGNAEAVTSAGELGPTDGPIAGARTGLGAGDAPRRQLSESDVAALVRSEVTERRAAADTYFRSAQTERAERLLAEASTLEQLMA